MGWEELTSLASSGRSSQIMSSSFELDGEFSHNPDDIPMFLEAAQNADLVLGSGISNGIRIINWPLRKISSANPQQRTVQLITGMPYTDPTGGYKCFRRGALECRRPPETALGRGLLHMR